MYTIILITHIIGMGVSIIAVASALLITLLRHQSALIAARVSLVATVVGLGMGTILMIYKPITLLCVELTLYLVGFAALYKVALTKERILARATVRSHDI